MNAAADSSERPFAQRQQFFERGRVASAWQHPVAEEPPGMESTFATHVLHVKVDNDLRSLQEVTHAEGEVNTALVCDSFEVAELVQQQAVLNDTSGEPHRIGERRRHSHDHREMFLSAEDMVRPKQLRSELSYKALEPAQPDDADRTLIEAVIVHFAHGAVEGILNEELVSRERCIISRGLPVNKGWK